MSRLSTVRCRRPSSIGWEPAFEELFECPLVDGCGQEFRALLIAPGIVDDEPSVVLAEIDVGIVDVAGLGDALALLGRELGVGDLLVLSLIHI